MKTLDSRLQRTFVEATDEVVPPAPWLETDVINLLRQPGRVRRSRRHGGAIGEFRPGIRLTASVAALLIAVGGVAVLLMSARNHTATQPGSKPTTVQLPSPGPKDTFVPSPAVRAPNWPAGQVVPAQMAGSWQAQISSQEIDLGGYTYQILDPSKCRPDTGTAWICRSGNVVVDGHAIYFMADACNPPSGNAWFGPFGYEKYSYRLAGNTLTLARATDAGLRDCGLRLDGTYDRIAAS